MTPRPRFWLIVTAILVLAGTLRLTHVAYGYRQICLTPPDEYWLYDQPQVSSLYATLVRVPEAVTVQDQTLTYPRMRTAATTDDAWLWNRFGGALLGLLTVALALRLALMLRANWWALAGLLAAAAPPLVTSDRWIVRFDPAPLAVAMSIAALVWGYQAGFRRDTLHPDPISGVTLRFAIGLQLLAALSLLLVAPPLWWLAAGLVGLQPHPKWRVIAFLAGVGLVAVPALQSPYHWLRAASEWDVGATAACLWAGLALGLWHFRRLSRTAQTVLFGGAGVMAALSLAGVFSLSRLTEDDWALVRWLQARIPDSARVSLDAAAWHLSPVADCPLGAHLNLTAQPISPRAPALPDFIVTTRRGDLSQSAYIHDLGNGYFVGRQLQLPYPVDIGFGELLYVASYQVVTPQVTPGATVHVRLDYQLMNGVTADALRYAAFIHATQPGQPAEKVAEFNLPFIEEMAVFGPRRFVTNQHYRFNLPPQTQPGVYDLLFGIYDVYSGQRLGWSEGDALPIGQIEVKP
jgi:hypothetical protein